MTKLVLFTVFPDGAKWRKDLITLRPNKGDCIRDNSALLFVIEVIICTKDHHLEVEVQFGNDMTYDTSEQAMSLRGWRKMTS